MPEESRVFSQELLPEDWSAGDQKLIAAMLAATPGPRLAWLEEALQLAYATGALKSRRFISKEEWETIGDRIRDRLDDCRNVALSPSRPVARRWNGGAGNKYLKLPKESRDGLQFFGRCYAGEHVQ